MQCSPIYYCQEDLRLGGNSVCQGGAALSTVIMAKRSCVGSQSSLETSSYCKLSIYCNWVLVSYVICNSGDTQIDLLLSINQSLFI